MIKEEEELKVLRKVLAKEAGLILNENGTRYLKTVSDDPNCTHRFYCNATDWTPDLNWNQFAYMAKNSMKFKQPYTVDVTSDLKEVFVEFVNSL